MAIRQQQGVTLFLQHLIRLSAVLSDIAAITQQSQLPANHFLIGRIVFGQQNYRTIRGRVRSVQLFLDLLIWAIDCCGALNFPKATVLAGFI